MWSSRGVLAKLLRPATLGSVPGCFRGLLTETQVGVTQWKEKQERALRDPKGALRRDKLLLLLDSDAPPLFPELQLLILSTNPRSRHQVEETLEKIRAFARAGG